MTYAQEVRDEAVRLRVEEQLGLKSIACQLNISKGTASLWLRNYPLPKEVLKKRLVDNGASSTGRNHSQETIRKLSELQKKSWTPEKRRKQSEWIKRNPHVARAGGQRSAYVQS